MNKFEKKASAPKFNFITVQSKKFILNPDISAFVNNTITRLRNFTSDMVRQLPANSIVITFKRDPRSLIVSCTDYHLRGTENWTRIPMEEYGGKSYYDYLRGAATDEERLIISMENKAGEIISNMTTFLDAPDILSVKLEDIVRDESCQTYYDICEYMQLSDRNYHILSNLFKKHSLWYIKKNIGALPGHSTSGVSKESINRLQGPALERYHDLFGDLHLRLGYQE